MGSRQLSTRDKQPINTLFMGYGYITRSQLSTQNHIVLVTRHISNKHLRKTHTNVFKPDRQTDRQRQKHGVH